MTGYGYTDSKKVENKAGGKFGKNKALLTKFEFNPNGGKNGAAQDSIDITVQVEEKEFKTRVFPINKVFAPGRNGRELTDVNSKEYISTMEKEREKLQGYLISLVECFIAPEDVQAALMVPIGSFKTYAEILQRLIQSTPNWNKKEIEVFLQYQFVPTGENTRSFLTLPTNLTHGAVFCPYMGDTYVEDRTETHLRYLDGENVHPLYRGEWFMKSAYAKQTILTETSMESATDGGDNWGA